ncbi:hypothetical protein E2320_018615 [Naja naja]|nr:hypothetical protein E2320_018615 [Naja naja]
MAGDQCCGLAFRRMESAVAETASGFPREGSASKEEGQNSPADPPPAPDTSVSFSEMLHLIQTGQDIPGLQKLNISATNGSPTPSQMTQKPKPWEAKA